MHFDDRLDTVLRLPAEGRAMARIQFRQLLDILGRGPDNLSAQGLQAGFARLDALGGLITPAERARILREPMTRLASPQLVRRLAAGEPDIAGAAIAAADLSEAQWLELIPTLPVQARGFMRHRGGFSPAVVALLDRLGILDRGLPAADATSADPAAVSAPMANAPRAVGEPVLEAVPEPVRLRERAPRAGAVVDFVAPRALSQLPTDECGEIGDIVRRIEAFRKARSTPANGTAADAPRLPLGDAPHPARPAVLALDFTTDVQGRVTWADGPEGAGLVGWRLSSADPAIQRAIQGAIRRRQPIAACALELDGAPALTGTWRLDAVPSFDGIEGRFTGYDGRLRRSTRVAATTPDPRRAEADRMRQILHELRTPANAIQVAAELIQQQLYGSVPHEYRALAAAIAGDTAQVLAGFDELDRLIKLEAGVQTPGQGSCDLGSLVAQTVTRLRAWTNPRNSGFGLPDPVPAVAVRLHEDDASRLVWRLLAALAGVTAPGEILPLSVTRRGTEAVLEVALPQKLALQAQPAAQPQLGPEPTRAAPNQRSLSAGTFGIGFTLRLAAAEAAAAGGLLERHVDQIRLRLPACAGTVASESHG